MTFDLGSTSGSNMNHFLLGQSVGPMLFPVISGLSKVGHQMVCGSNIVFTMGPTLTSGATNEDQMVCVSSLASLKD